MTHDELKDTIPRRLGKTWVKVELETEDIEEAVNASYRWFNEKIGGRQVSDPVVLITNESEYALEGVRSVSNVYMPTSPQFHPPFFDPIGIPPLIPLRMLGRARYSELTQHLQYIKTVKRIVGADTAWDFKNGKLLLVPPPNKGGGTLIYEGMKELDNINQLTQWSMINLIIRYAMADAKELLGRHRSKYDAYPAAGGTVGLDGERLLLESKEEKEKLDDEILERGFPVPFIVG